MSSNNYDDDELIFIDEDDSHEEPETATGSWNVLVVDDDKEIHSVTKLALSDLIINDKYLKFNHAYSGKEALEFLKENPDMALILLDVVMEADDSGLKVAKAIREDLKLTEPRIVLRTGQPGYAPEESVIKEYDINDYKTKTELTRSKLVTTIIASIRSYQQIKAINQSRQGLEKIIYSAANLLEEHSMEGYSEGVLTQISSLLGLRAEGVLCAKTGMVDESGEERKGIFVLGAAGHYAPYINNRLENVDNGRIINQITRCLKEQQHLFEEVDTTLYIHSSEYEAAVYIESGHPLEEMDRQLIEVFLSSISIGYENVNLFNQLRNAAYRDWLTKLPNRTEFINLLENFAQSKTGVGDVTALIDIRHFSDFNDGLGQDIGNELLLAIANRLVEHLDDSCIIARIGADVFGLIGDDSQINPDNINQVFVDPFKAGDHHLPVDITVGLCRKVDCSQSGLVVLKQAYIALNRAKKNLKSNADYYAPEMEEQTAWRLGMIRQLRNDFSEGRLQLWYQPQFAFDTKKPVGMEALLRWPSRDGGFVPPSTFVPLAEYSGLIVDIGRWVIDKACEQLHELITLGHKDLRVAINVSMPQFRDPNFVQMVRDVVSKYTLTPEQIELEITESVVMDEPKIVIQALNELKAFGVNIAIDDFGTGFSSLSYLQQLPLDRIKIDRAFVKDITDGSDGEGVLAETIISLGQKLNLITIAEGVETQDQSNYLEGLGCEEVQGFMYAKPMHRNDLLEFLKSSD